jgi:hypothetical protein
MSDAWLYAPNLTDPEAAKEAATSRIDRPRDHRFRTDPSEPRAIRHGARLERGAA